MSQLPVNRCTDDDCINYRQPTDRGCKCHKTSEQMLSDELARLREINAETLVALQALYYAGIADFKLRSKAKVAIDRAGGQL